MHESDLKRASCQTLVKIIAEQQKVIAELSARVEELENRNPPRSQARGMAGNKPCSRRSRPKRTGSCKRRTEGFSRRRMEPDRRVIHALESCSECGTGMSGGWVHRTREVIEIPLTRSEVVEHVYVGRMCALCRKRRLPEDALGGQAVGRRRFGVNLMSLIATLREEARLPIRSIQWYFQTVHRLRLSVGAIVDAIHAVSERASSEVSETLERIRGSPAVHADESGWREDGVNGYVWTFSTPTERYFVRRGRNKELVDEVLGESFAGVLISDFYAAYNHYPGLKQRCWVHLLRDISDLKAMRPDDDSVAIWAAEVKRVYDKARTLAVSDGRLVSGPQLALEERLLSLCRPFSSDESAPQAKLCRRIERFIKELFVFVSHPQVRSDNNPAERSLRHLVVSRNISGGTRSARGTDSKMTLASAFGSWRAKELDPLLQCRRLLTSH